MWLLQCKMLWRVLVRWWIWWITRIRWLPVRVLRWKLQVLEWRLLI